MSVRVEKDANGGRALVFSGFDKGIADSPYSGIANIRNLNTSFYPGVAYVNYKRLVATLSGGTMTKPMYSCKSPAGIIYILDDSQQVWKQSSVGGTTFTIVTGNPSSGGQGNGIAFWQSYLVVFRSTAIDVCGDGTGDGGVTSSNWNTGAGTAGVWPIIGATITLTATIAVNDVSATISTYTDAQGNSRAFWNGPTGVYQLAFSSGQIVDGTLTQGSAAITWSAKAYATGTTSVTLTALFSGQHQAFVSPSDGSLYFCNGQYVGKLNIDLSDNFTTFVKGSMQTFRFAYGPVRIQNDTVTWLDQLGSNLVIAGVSSIYIWDRVSAAAQAPLYLPENIVRMKQVQNIVYIFAGYKGDIYQTNGYSVSLLKKIPDSFWGLIDPYLQWGGVMAHRNKLYFQVYASSASGTGSAMGIFSISLTSGQLPTELDTSGSMVMENQNSFGYTITATASQNGILEDYPTATNDSYFSAFYNNTAGGVDYNDSTLYQNYEPVIETDLAPTGTYLESRTFENIEFKLDRQLASGDFIRLSYRESLSDSYTVIGTSDGTTLQLSDNYNSSINTAQWLQLKIEFKCASSSSSRIPLREVRIH